MQSLIHLSFLCQEEQKCGIILCFACSALGSWRNTVGTSLLRAVEESSFFREFPVTF